MYMKKYETMWWYKDLYDGTRVYKHPYGCIWKYMMVDECKW